MKNSHLALQIALCCYTSPMSERAQFLALPCWIADWGLGEQFARSVLGARIGSWLLLQRVVYKLTDTSSSSLFVAAVVSDAVAASLDEDHSSDGSD